jgi:hypothetical protein
MRIQKMNIRPIIELWLLVGLIMALSSCSVSKRIKKCEKFCVQITDTITQTNTETVELTEYVDVPYYIPADTSAFLKALIECDSNYKAQIKILENKKGNRSVLKPSINKNVLTVTCKADSLTGVVKALNKTIQRQTNKIQTLSRPCPDLSLTKWQRLKIDWGGYWLLLIVVYVVYRLAKAYYRVNTPMGLLLAVKRRLT